MELSADRSSQSLYYPAGHPREGIFKGMAVILAERGFANLRKMGRSWYDQSELIIS